MCKVVYGFSVEELLLAFADSPVEAALDLADGEAGFAGELTGGFLGVGKDVALDVVLRPLFRDVEAFPAEVFLYRRGGIRAVFVGDVVEQIVVFVTHGVVTVGPDWSGLSCACGLHRELLQ